jgi:hypothetical protein
MGRFGPRDTAGGALLATGAVVVGALALTEHFGALVAAASGYAAAWWVLALEPHAPRPGESR